jgi:hypothetical protein
MLKAVYNTWLIHISITWGTGLYKTMSAHKYSDTQNADWLSIMTTQERKFGKNISFLLPQYVITFFEIFIL